jgi:hypothetical protein
MKLSLNLLLVGAICFSASLRAQTSQELLSQIEAAKKAAVDKNYKEVNFSLQQALGTLAAIVGNEVLNQLPVDINGLKSVKENDRVTNAGLMMAGTSIQREYVSGENNRIDLTIIVNSPMVASLAMIINNPMYTSSMGGNEKVISVNGKRGMLKMDKENKGAELQIVSGQNLITINATGMINSEADITAIASKLDFAKLDALIGY